MPTVLSWLKCMGIVNYLFIQNILETLWISLLFFYFDWTETHSLIIQKENFDFNDHRNISIFLGKILHGRKFLNFIYSEFKNYCHIFIIAKNVSGLSCNNGDSHYETHAGFSLNSNYWLVITKIKHTVISELTVT